MKNISFITFSLQGGGSEKRVLRITSYLNSKGKFLTDIISFKKIIDYKNYYQNNNHSKILYLTDYQTKIPRLLLLPVLLTAILKMIHQMKKKKYSVLIGIDIFSWFLVYVCRIFCGSSYILNACIPISQETGRWSFLFQPIVSKAEKIICISKGVAYDLVKLYKIPKEKIAVIYNGVAVDKYYINKKDDDNKLLKDFKEMKKIQRLRFIITVGRLVPQKNQEVLIRSFQYVHGLDEKTALIILGKGPLENKLKKLTYELKVNNSIYFLGFIKYPENYLKIADIFVLSSLYEGFGNVIVESMAQGLPVISTDCSYGPREIISSQQIGYPVKPVNKITYEKYGILIPPLEKINISRKDYLSEAMLHLLNNDKLKKHYCHQGIIRAREFSTEKMAEQYLSTIKALIGE